jgi:hypothetical protein
MSLRKQPLSMGEQFIEVITHPNAPAPKGFAPEVTEFLRNLSEVRRKLNEIEVLHLGGMTTNLMKGQVDQQMRDTITFLNKQLDVIMTHLKNEHV